MMKALPRGIVILGNGPSLNDTVARSADFLAARDLLAVNFAACTPLFKQLRPRYYLLADNHFFKALDQPNVAKLWGQHSRYRPRHDAFRSFSRQIAATARKSASYHSPIQYHADLEGFPAFENLCFDMGLGMPRPRNVLIPSIMMAIGMGYKQIYIAGADHSWTRTLSVDDDNNVVSVQPQFL